MKTKKPLLSHAWKVKPFKQFVEQKQKELPKLLQKKRLHSNEK